ncbi:thiamine pyrophosphate-binding protein [Rhodococcus indonesiensis]
MKVYEAMAKAFVDEGVDTLFSYMGDANMWWMTSLLDTGVVNNVHVRHENSAVAMADGYARSTGNIGVATVTSGPGLTHTATAVIGAARYGVPMVIFGGDTMPGDAGALQYVDHRAFAAMCGIHCEPVVSPGRALDAVRAAFQRARTLREPVLLSVPMNLQEEDYPKEYSYAGPPEGEGSSAFVPSGDDLDAAAGLVVTARRPVIVVGAGATSPRALSAVEKLGDRIGALYATSLRAKGALDSSPWSLGIAGTFSWPYTQEMMGKADLIIGVGASLNRFTQQEGYLFPQARTLQILDRSPSTVPHALPATKLLHGDPALTVEALEDLLASGEVESDGFRSEFRQQRWDPYADGGKVPDDERRMDPRRAIELLEEVIPSDALVVSGAGHFWSFVNMGLTGRNGKQFMYCMGFGSIGQALAVAVGASVGLGGRPVVVIDGDSSVLMYIAELDTAVRKEVPLLTVVLDDDAMGAELHKLILKSGTPDAAIVPTPGLAQIARGFGADGAIVDSEDELAGMLSGYDWRSVFLLDIKVSRSIVDLGGAMGNQVVTE